MVVIWFDSRCISNPAFNGKSSLTYWKKIIESNLKKVIKSVW
jgi:hypothetical protein